MLSEPDPLAPTTTAPISEPVLAPLSETSSATVEQPKIYKTGTLPKTPSSSSKGEVFKAYASVFITDLTAFAEEHALIIFAVAIILALAVLIAIMPKVALIALAAVAAASGWIAYYHLKKKSKL